MKLMCSCFLLQACPANTVTPDQISAEDAAPEPTTELQAAVTSNAVTSADQCSALPGYGWDGGVSVPCELGYYAPGYDNQVGVRRTWVEPVLAVTTAQHGQSHIVDWTCQCRIAACIAIWDCLLLLMLISISNAQVQST
jgi:hypothetical protein